MGLEVYYPADIRNALRAAEQGVDAVVQGTTMRSDAHAASFLAGYRAALTTLALAFGLAMKPGITKERNNDRRGPN
jgi:hypothetical protein